MTEDGKLQRKVLARPLAAIRQQPQEQAPSVLQVAERHGFDTVPTPAAELARLEANQAPMPPRRKRAKGRSLQFNVKLDQPTIDYIYEVANGRDIPLAQVIEEFVEIHRATRGGGEARG